MGVKKEEMRIKIKQNGMISGETRLASIPFCAQTINTSALAIMPTPILSASLNLNPKAREMEPEPKTFPINPMMTQATPNQRKVTNRERVKNQKKVINQEIMKMRMIKIMKIKKKCIKFLVVRG